ncbi:hypothetical protein NE237_019089 [Protea cynaroides]|uniref:Uncharacterized protein n=1 Tax=Protea cynaroides TaxID=273540 RepID=A0A9Q0QPJ1_9MAGN|nr:hypothetical protein NE237_019089 [Protea cynaroides]
MHSEVIGDCCTAQGAVIGLDPSGSMVLDQVSIAETRVSRVEDQGCMNLDQVLLLDPRVSRSGLQNIAVFRGRSCLDAPEVAFQVVGVVARSGGTLRSSGTRELSVPMPIIDMHIALGGAVFNGVASSLMVDLGRFLGLPNVEVPDSRFADVVGDSRHAIRTNTVVGVAEGG